MSDILVTTYHLGHPAAYTALNAAITANAAAGAVNIIGTAKYLENGERRLILVQSTTTTGVHTVGTSGTVVASADFELQGGNTTAIAAWMNAQVTAGATHLQVFHVQETFDGQVQRVFAIMSN